MFGRERGISRKELMMFFRHILAFIDQLPIAQIVQSWEPPSEGAALFQKRVHTYMQRDGMTFHEALVRATDKVTPIESLIIQLGEESGELDRTLQDVVKEDEERQAVKRRIRNAVLTPAITLFVGFLALVLAVYVIIPRYKKIFLSFVTMDKLPSATRMVIEACDWLREYGHVIGIAALVVAVLLVKNVPATSLPLVRRVAWNYCCYVFFQGLSLLVRVGIPFQEAVRRIERELLGTSSLYLKLREISRSLYKMMLRGTTPDAAFKRYEKDFTKPVILYVTMAVRAGTFDRSLADATEYLKNRYVDSVSSLAGIIQPTAIVITGTIVAMLLLTLWMPLFELAQVVK